MMVLKLKFNDREVLATASVGADFEVTIEYAQYMDDSSDLDELELIVLEEENMDVLIEAAQDHIGVAV